MEHLPIGDHLDATGENNYKLPLNSKEHGLLYSIYGVYDGVRRRVSGLRREPMQSLRRTPAHRSTHPTEKQDSVLQTPTLSLLLFYSGVLCTKLATKGSESCFSVGCVDRLGSSTETAGSLRKLETQCTPSYGEGIVNILSICF